MEIEPTEKMLGDAVDWEKLQYHVLHELQRLNDNFEKFREDVKKDQISDREKIHGLAIDVSNIKTKHATLAMIFGLLGAYIIPFGKAIAKTFLGKD